MAFVRSDPKTRAILVESTPLSELRHLQGSILPGWLYASLIGGWLWFVYTLTKSWPLGLNAAPTLVLSGLLLPAYKLRDRHYVPACALFLLGLISFVILLAQVHPEVPAMALGVLVIIAANSLLGTWEALLTPLITWGLGMAVLRGPVRFAPEPSDGNILVLYLLTFGATYLASRPLRTSVEWTVSSWRQAIAALAEVRDRRGELHRALRALEEASFRLERTNNELLVAQREAEEARALKERFAATISHEIRGPLNLILGFSRMMALNPERYGEPLPRAYQEDVDTIYRNSQHLLALVDDILDLSQIEAQRLPLVKDQVDLEEDVIKKTAATVQPLAERKNLFLRLELAGNLPWVLADPVRLRQVLLNLLTNAIRFTEHGGITVRTAQRDDALWVTVHDTGPGIAPDEIPKLFKEFHLVHLTETREQQGSGLGLSICKHLVELHGGQISVESQVGVGTSFTFSIPLPESASASKPFIKTGEAQRTIAASKTCLVLHDDPAVIRLLSRYVEGFRVLGVAREENVPALVEQLHPRAIVANPCDIPHLSAQLERTPFDVPLISCGMPSLEQQGHNLGILGYLIKPITPETIMALMRQVEREDETTVLLVDDEPDAVRLLEGMLTTLPHPYQILKAYDGAQALAIMRQVVPDVVFLDWVMPGLSGRQTIETMRADARLAHVPVVVVSGKDWWEGSATLQLPLQVQRKKPLELARGARCLQTLLEMISPDYLSGVVGGRSS